jgi:hypothetical protein
MFDYAMLGLDTTGECTINITNNTYMTPGMIFDGTPRGDGNGTRQVAFYLEVDPNIIESSPIYFTPPDDTDPSAQPWINFCATIMTYSEDRMLINWIDFELFFYTETTNQGFFSERRYLVETGGEKGASQQLNEDRFTTNEPFHRHLLRCLDGFDAVFNANEGNKASSPAQEGTLSPELAIVLSPENAVDFGGDRAEYNIEDAYNVIGYVCDANLTRLHESEQEALLYPGDTTVRICVERNNNCVRDNIYIRRIDAFAFFQDTKRQVAVEPVNKPAASGLTELYCESGSELCYFETILDAKFFTKVGQVTGLGAASLQFGSSSSQRRVMQQMDEDISRTRGFDMTFNVTSEEPLVETAGEVSDSTETTMLLYGIVGGACFIIIAMWCAYVRYKHMRGRNHQDTGRESKSNKSAGNVGSGLGDCSHGSTDNLDVGDIESMADATKGSDHDQSQREDYSIAIVYGLDDSDVESITDISVTSPQSMDKAHIGTVTGCCLSDLPILTSAYSSQSDIVRKNKKPKHKKHLSVPKISHYSTKTEASQKRSTSVTMGKNAVVLSNLHTRTELTMPRLPKPPTGIARSMSLPSTIHNHKHGGSKKHGKKKKKRSKSSEHNRSSVDLWIEPKALH